MFGSTTARAARARAESSSRVGLVTGTYAGGCGDCVAMWLKTFLPARAAVIQIGSARSDVALKPSVRSSTVVVGRGISPFDDADTPVTSGHAPVQIVA